MLFDDAERFVSSFVANPVDPALQGIGRGATASHVGPGSYRTDGDTWNKRSFSTVHAAFNTSPKKESRSDSYVYGSMTSGGMISSPRSPRHRDSPGPGYYEGATPSLNPSPSKFPRDNSFSCLSSKGGRLSSTPRFNFSNSSVLRGEVLFQSKLNETRPLGPGYYAVARESFIKPSHNVRANNSSRLASGNNSSNFSYASSPAAARNPLMNARPSSASRSTGGGKQGRGAPSPAGPPDFIRQQQQQQRGTRSSSAPRMGSRSRQFNNGTPSKGLFSDHGMIPAEY